MSIRSPFDGNRQSPFVRRQNSVSPAPSSSPIKAAGSLSPTKPKSLSPEKTSPFVRRPSQLNAPSDRPSSPLARPPSSLGVGASFSRKISDDNQAETLPSSISHPPVRQTDLASSARDALDGTASSSEESPERSASLVLSRNQDRQHTASRGTTFPTATSTTSATSTPRATTIVPTARFIPIGGGGAGYNHVSQALLHSMRESFEVLDSGNSGSVNAAAVSEMLAQMGMDNTPAALRAFFPPNSPSQFNLARYLDMLSGPMVELSQPHELRAAFEAFDLDDSGQIDVAVLRDALLHTAPQPGEQMVRLSEREMDGILGDFMSRRAFGARGMHASKDKGEVFRYREFMASVSGSGGGAGEQDAAVAV